MTKHTPGPWKTGRFDKDTVWAGNMRHMCRIFPVTDKIGEAEKSKTEAEANARLIAAAPDMYELLRAVLKTEPHASVAFPIITVLDRIGGNDD